MAIGRNDVVLSVGGDVSSLNRSIQGVVSRQYNIPVNIDASSLRKFSLPLGRISGDINQFESSLNASVARVLAFGASASVLAGVGRALRSVVEAGIEVEKTFVDINRIFNLSQSKMEEFSNGLFDVAKSTAQSFKVTGEAAAELARQGLSSAETLKRLNDALTLSRLSGMSSVKSVETLTATINGFKKEALTSTQILNKLVSVDQSYAVSTEDLANALARSGAAAQDAGISFDQLIASVTAVQQATARGGSVIGNGLKTISTRILRANVRETFEKIGIATTDANGNFRAAIPILQDYARVSKTLTDAQRAQIDEQIAGVFQINTLKALLKSLSGETSVYEGALKKSASATNEASTANEKLNQTTSALLAQTSVELTHLSKTINELISKKGIDKVLNIVDSLASKINGLLDPKSAKDGPSKLFGGLAKSLAKSVGDFLSGPGLALLFVGLVKLLGFLAKETLAAAKQIGSLNFKKQEQKKLEDQILVSLLKEVDVTEKLRQAGTNQANIQKQIYEWMAKQRDELKFQARIRSAITPIAAAALSRRSPQTKAAGYVPNFAQSAYDREVSLARTLGAGPSVRAHKSKGRIGGKKFVMNSHEVEIPNFGKNGDSAVIPLYSKGYVPNFAHRKEGDVLALDADSLGGIGVLTPYGDSGFVSSPVSNTASKGLENLHNFGVQGRVRLDNIQVKSINSALGSLEQRRQNFRNQINETFAAPIVSLADRMFTSIVGPQNYSEKQSALRGLSVGGILSSSAEGAIFESAARVAAKNTKQFSKALGDNLDEGKPFDFEEDGGVTSPLSSFFNRKVFKADAKRTVGAEQLFSILKKTTTDPDTRFRLYGSLKNDLGIMMGKMEKPRGIMVARDTAIRYGQKGITSLEKMMSNPQFKQDYEAGKISHIGGDKKASLQHIDFQKTAGFSTARKVGPKLMAAGYIPNFAQKTKMGQGYFGEFSVFNKRPNIGFKKFFNRNDNTKSVVQVELEHAKRAYERLKDNPLLTAPNAYGNMKRSVARGGFGKEVMTGGTLSGTVEMLKQSILGRPSPTGVKGISIQQLDEVKELSRLREHIREIARKEAKINGIDFDDYHAGNIAVKRGNLTKFLREAIGGKLPYQATQAEVEQALRKEGIQLSMIDGFHVNRDEPIFKDFLHYADGHIPNFASRYSLGYGKFRPNPFGIKDAIKDPKTFFKNLLPRLLFSGGTGALGLYKKFKEGGVAGDPYFSASRYFAGIGGVRTTKDDLDNITFDPKLGQMIHYLKGSMGYPRPPVIDPKDAYQNIIGRSRLGYAQKGEKLRIQDAYDFDHSAFQDISNTLTRENSLDFSHRLFKTSQNGKLRKILDKILPNVNKLLGKYGFNIEGGSDFLMDSAGMMNYDIKGKDYDVARLGSPFLNRIKVTDQKGLINPKGKEVELSNYASGHIPPLKDAISRELGAGIPASAVRVESSHKLQNRKNPLGLAVTNTIDEPRGLKDVFAQGNIPNYARRAYRQKDFEDSAKDIIARRYREEMTAKEADNALTRLKGQFDATGKEMAKWYSGLKNVNSEIKDLEKAMASSQDRSMRRGFVDNPLVIDKDKGNKIFEKMSRERLERTSSSLGGGRNTEREITNAVNGLVDASYSFAQKGKLGTKSQFDILKRDVSIGRISKEEALANLNSRDLGAKSEQFAQQIKDQKINKFREGVNAKGSPESLQRAFLLQFAGSTILNSLPDEGETGAVKKGGLTGLSAFSTLSAFGASPKVAGGIALIGGVATALDAYLDKSDDLKKEYDELSSKITESSDAANTYIGKQQEINEAMERGDYTTVKKLRESSAELFDKLSDPQLRSALANAGTDVKLMQKAMEDFGKSGAAKLAAKEFELAAATTKTGFTAIVSQIKDYWNFDFKGTANRNNEAIDRMAQLFKSDYKTKTTSKDPTKIRQEAMYQRKTLDTVIKGLNPGQSADVQKLQIKLWKNELLKAGVDEKAIDTALKGDKPELEAFKKSLDMQYASYNPTKLLEDNLLSLNQELDSKVTEFNNKFRTTMGMIADNIEEEARKLNYGIDLVGSFITTPMKDRNLQLKNYGVGTERGFQLANQSLDFDASRLKAEGDRATLNSDLYTKIKGKINAIEIKDGKIKESEIGVALATLSSKAKSGTTSSKDIKEAMDSIDKKILTTDGGEVQYQEVRDLLKDQYKLLSDSERNQRAEEAAAKIQRNKIIDSLSTSFVNTLRSDVAGGTKSEDILNLKNQFLEVFKGKGFGEAARNLNPTIQSFSGTNSQNAMAFNLGTGLSTFVESITNLTNVAGIGKIKTQTRDVRDNARGTLDRETTSQEKIVSAVEQAKKFLEDNKKALQAARIRSLNGVAFAKDASLLSRGGIAEGIVEGGNKQLELLKRDQEIARRIQGGETYEQANRRINKIERVRDFIKGFEPSEEEKSNAFTKAFGRDITSNRERQTLVENASGNQLATLLAELGDPSQQQKKISENLEGMEDWLKKNLENLKDQDKKIQDTVMEFITATAKAVSDITENISKTREAITVKGEVALNVNSDGKTQTFTVGLNPAEPSKESVKKTP